MTFILLQNLVLSPKIISILHFKEVLPCLKRSLFRMATCFGIYDLTETHLYQLHKGLILFSIYVLKTCVPFLYLYERLQ